MSQIEQPLVEDEIYEPEEVELTEDQKVALAAIDQLDARLAQGFNNMSQAFSSILNQYSTQAQICIELLRAEFGETPSAQAVEFKVRMDEATEAMQQEQEAAMQAAAQLAEEEGKSSDV